MIITPNDYVFPILDELYVFRTDLYSAIMGERSGDNIVRCIQTTGDPDFHTAFRGFLPVYYKYAYRLADDVADFANSDELQRYIYHPGNVWSSNATVRKRSIDALEYIILKLQRIYYIDIHRVKPSNPITI